MTVVVLGLDALDPDITDPEDHPNLVLDHYKKIDTIVSGVGEPSTHELWPTIITGLTPDEHKIKLDEGGVAWSNKWLNVGSKIANHTIPEGLQSRIGAWIFNNTNQSNFRLPANYYRKNDLSTLFDNVTSKTIGIPNYVVDPGDEDREHSLRKQLGNFMDFDPTAEHTHTTTDRTEFYELCIEMMMVRIARIRSALRSGRYELVFGYTSGLDLVGHIAYDIPDMQLDAYDESDDFVGELESDIGEGDELLIVSDHGLQDGVHTREAMVSGTDEEMVESIDSVLDVRAAVEEELRRGNHEPQKKDYEGTDIGEGEKVREQLEDLGYM